MSLKFGTSAVNTVTYNGNDVKQIVFNGSSAWAKPYTLSISKGTGVASVTVSRTSTLEPTASTGSVSAGSGTIFHGDSLSVSAAASDGYLLDDYAALYIVSGNTSVSVTATEAVWKTIWDGNYTACSPRFVLSAVAPIRATTEVIRASDLGLSWLPKLPTKISGVLTESITVGGTTPTTATFSLKEVSSATYLGGWSSGSGTTSNPTIASGAYATLAQDSEETLLAAYQINIDRIITRSPTSTTEKISGTFVGVAFTEIQQFGPKEQLQAPTLSNIYTDSQDTLYVHVTVSNPHPFSVTAYLTCYDGAYPDIIMGSTSVTISANGSAAVSMDTGSSGQIYAEATAYLSKTNYFDSEEVVIAE